MIQGEEDNLEWQFAVRAKVREEDRVELLLAV